MNPVAYTCRHFSAVVPKSRALSVDGTTSVLKRPFAVIVSAVASPKVTLPVADSVVNAPVLAVVAPTVPLMLMDAVPVRFVTVPLDGVPNTPPLTTTAPAVPTLTARAVATPVPRPEMPVATGRPVALVKTPEAGVPSAGVTKVGLVANTRAPVPVSSVTADRRLAELGVAKKVATPVPKPLTPVLIGKPVALVRVPDDGVPKAPPLTTGEPAVPTLTAKAVATPVPRPDTPVLMGRPVALVKVALEGVPRAGVTNVGEVANTASPLPVSSVNAPARLADVNDPSDVAFPTEVTAPVRLAFVVTLPAVRPDAVPVMLVPTNVEGVPRFGVTKVGLVAKTNKPEPVSSVTAAAKLAEEGVAKNVATPAPRPETPVLIGKPVPFVSVTDEGVPKAGVTSVGEVDITTLPVPVMALLTSAFEPLVNTAWLAVSAVIKGAAVTETTPVESAICKAAVPSLALMFVTSTFVASTVVAFN